MGNILTWRLENGTLTVDTQGTLHKFLSEEEKLKIQKVVIGKSCSRIGGDVFAGCTNLLEVILPESLRIIAENAFKDCHQLKNIVFPGRLIGLCEGAFHNCYALEIVNLPKHLHSLPNHVFRGCRGIKKLILPEKILRIGKYALPDCGAEIFFRGNPVRIQGDRILHKDTKDVLWYLSTSKGTVKLDREPFKLYSDTLGNFPGVKIVAYDTDICNWNQQKPTLDAQLVITVRHPFYCSIGESFWTAYQDNQFVKARLISILSSDDSGAQIRVQVLNVLNLLDFIRPISEDEKSRLLREQSYDAKGFGGDIHPPFWKQVDVHMVEVFNTWGGGDYNFHGYIITDVDGIDHHVIGKHGGRLFVGDRVLGHNLYFPY